MLLTLKIKQLLQKIYVTQCISHYLLTCITLVKYTHIYIYSYIYVSQSNYNSVQIVQGIGKSCRPLEWFIGQVSDILIQVRNMKKERTYALGFVSMTTECISSKYTARRSADAPEITDRCVCFCNDD